MNLESILLIKISLAQKDSHTALGWLLPTTMMLHAQICPSGAPIITLRSTPLLEVFLEPGKLQKSEPSQRLLQKQGFSLGNPISSMGSESTPGGPGAQGHRQSSLRGSSGRQCPHVRGDHPGNRSEGGTLGSSSPHRRAGCGGETRSSRVCALASFQSSEA